MEQEELEPAGDVFNPFWTLFSFSSFLLSVLPGIEASLGAISGLLYDWGNRSESGRARSKHTRGSQWWSLFLFSGLPSFVFFFFFFNFCCGSQKGPHLRAGDLWERYYAHAWLFDLCWDRKDFFFDSASGCKIS